MYRKSTILVLTVVLAIYSAECIQNHYKNITDCVYYPSKSGSIGRNNTLKLICTENSKDSDANLSALFKTFTCRDQFLCGEKCKNSLPKFLVDTISFENCNLPRLPSDLLGIYNFTKTLVAVDLGLTELEPENFVNATKLIDLIAKHNKIKSLPANLLNQSRQIESVDFSYNEINYLDETAFGIENELKKLTLSFNNISDLSTISFQRLGKLQKLQLSHNHIAVVPSFQFQNMEQLMEIDISFNQIELIEDFAFSGDFPHLKIVRISQNRLNNTEFAGELVNLTMLDVSWNRITSLSVFTFRELHNLQHLDVSGNPIERIGSDTFAWSVKLQHLNLSATALSVIEPHTFAMLQQLRTLDLSSCQLKKLDRTILPPHLKLQLLSIANNQLTELNGFSTENIRNTIIYGIDSNRFNCTYLHNFLLSFVWKQFGSNYVWFSCNSAAKKQNETIDGKTQAISSENETAHQNDDLLSLKKYIFLLVSIMIIGFITIALVFVALILSVGVCNQRKQPHPQFYPNNYYGRAPKFIDNHIYDIIDDNSKWI